jgi:hypothetical protein
MLHFLHVLQCKKLSWQVWPVTNLPLHACVVCDKRKGLYWFIWTASACVSWLQAHTLNLLQTSKLKKKLTSHPRMDDRLMIDRCRRNVITTISNELISSSELSELCTNHCKREQIDTYAWFFFSELSRCQADNYTNHLQLATWRFIWIFFKGLSKQLGSHISFIFSFDLYFHSPCIPSANSMHIHVCIYNYRPSYQ